jgi:hypothetical protein
MVTAGGFTRDEVRAHAVALSLFGTKAVQFLAQVSLATAGLLALQHSVRCIGAAVAHIAGTSYTPKARGLESVVESILASKVSP